MKLLPSLLIVVAAVSMVHSSPASPPSQIDPGEAERLEREIATKIEEPGLTDDEVLPTLISVVTYMDAALIAGFSPPPFGNIAEFVEVSLDVLCLST